MHSEFLIPIVIVPCICAMIVLIVWLRARVREREAYHQSEVRKRLLEGQGVSADVLERMMREEDRLHCRRRREGLKLAGLILCALGIALMVTIGLTEHEALPGGAIPFAIGASILLYVYLIGAKCD